MFMPILMKTWLKRSVTTPTAISLAQAIARLAGDSDPGEQNHPVQREHDHAADESFLLGNDGENEVVVRHCPRQVPQGILRALPPAFARQPARADGNQRLPHIVRIIKLLLAQAFPLRLRRTGGSVIFLPKYTISRRRW